MTIFAKIFFLMKVFYILFLLLSNSIIFSQEICDNGIDDDGDGQIDLNDSDCVCQNEITSSLVNNHDFEQMNFCPNNFAQFNAATNWFLPSSATTDYINSCNFVPASALDAGIYPLPSSNGNGVAGILVSQDYKEFIGACTNTTLLAGTKYQLNFDIASSTSGRILSNSPNIGQVCNDGILNAGKINITLYGRLDCNTSSQPNTNNFPSGWQPLGTATYIPSKNWHQLSIIFTPFFNVNSIMLGSPNNLPNSYIGEIDYRSCFPYFYLDNILLSNVSNLGVKINSTGSFCENSLILNADLDSTIGSGYSFQWYKNGIAIVGATNSNLSINYNINNIGNYQVKIYNSDLCKISPFYNVNMVIDVPDYSIDQSPCFPGITTLTITSPAEEYSFDNGITWSTNPSKDNLTAFYNPIKILIKKNGCISNARYVILTYPPIETNSPPDVNVIQPGCQTNGSITVTTPALEYSFDNGVTWTTNPTINNLPPSNQMYMIKIRTLLGCISNPRGITMLPFRLPEPTATKTNASCGFGGTITITTQAQEYSINGGVSWSTNPFFSNLNQGSYNLMIKNEFNCISEIKTIYIGTDNLQIPQVSSTQPSCGILGTITVITQATEYSFDDGITWTTNNSATNLAPGFYNVRVKDSQNCISLSELIHIQPYILDINIEYTKINSSCTNNGSINIQTIAQEYSIDNGVTWTSSPTFNSLNSNYYNIKVRNGINCESNPVFVNLQDFTDITPNYQITNAGCNTYGGITITTVADLFSFDNGLTWSSNNTISNLTGNINFILLVKKNNCTSQPINVNFNSSYFPLPIVNNHNTLICDNFNNGNENIDLTIYNNEIISNSTNYTFRYFNTLNGAQIQNNNDQISNPNSFNLNTTNKTIYVLVRNSNGCLNIAELELELIPTPIIDLENLYYLCENYTVTIKENSGFDSYTWSDGTLGNIIVINQPGNYSLTVTENHGNIICSTTKNFQVILSNPSTFVSLETDDWTENHNVFQINVSGLGNYEYSLNGIDYQDSNTFTDLPNGEYLVYVRDKNGCGISVDEFYLLMYPKYFTPNKDGYNDYWKIKFSENEPNLMITIFDRYGKLMTQFDSFNIGWDGTYQGNQMPSSDYWFVVKRENGKEHRGHFTLKR